VTPTYFAKMERSHPEIFCRPNLGRILPVCRPLTFSGAQANSSILLTQPDVRVLLSTLSFYNGELQLPAQTLADWWLRVARDNVLVY
jgi:hypothetical protein